MGGKERNMGERGKISKSRTRKIISVQSQVEYNFAQVPKGKHVLEVLEMPCAPQKPNWAATTWKKKLLNTE